jgi:hypothetical protein
MTRCDARPAARGAEMSREGYGASTALFTANQAIRKTLHRNAFVAGTVLGAPRAELCTDNGAMIAWRARRGWRWRGRNDSNSLLVVT